MIIGIPKEIKNHEYRVGLVPSSVHEFVRHGHDVFVESNAGVGIGFCDDDYKKAGAVILSSAKEVFKKAEMIIKVKEPQLIECEMLHEGQILFTFLHLAPDLEQTKALIKSKCIAIAYETVTDIRGGLPLLAPMSEVAGRMSVQVGAWLLEKAQGGVGVLLGGVPGVLPAKVVVLGGGVVGLNAARIAVGMGADVIIVDKNASRLQYIDGLFEGSLKTVVPTQDLIESLVIAADLVVGAVLVAGASAPKLITADTVKKMKSGAVMVDVAIDQGGCFETSKPTTHDNPYYKVDGVTHYCVTNMPGAVAKTSTLALNNATLPFALALANKGFKKALCDDVHLKNGLNVCLGHVTCEAVSQSLKIPYRNCDDFLS